VERIDVLEDIMGPLRLCYGDAKRVRDAAMEEFAYRAAKFGWRGTQRDLQWCIREARCALGMFASAEEAHLHALLRSSCGPCTEPT